MLESLKNNEKLILYLQRVEEIMVRQVESRHDNVQDMLTKMIKSGGKMLRPAFLLLSAEFGSCDSEQKYELAAGIEMLHVATLIHDDIIDEADVRRGLETAQQKYGKDYAVFMGDFLLNRSFALISKGSYMPDVLKTMEKIFYGEMLQYNNRYCRETSIARYIKIAANKTASLFALSFYLGGRVSGADEPTCLILKRMGTYFGIAFQIIDDILDFSCDQETAQKSVRNDIKMGFYTLPIIYTSKANSEKIWEVIESSDFNQLAEYVEESGGIRKTTELASRYIGKAEAEMMQLPDIEAKDTILEVLHSLKRFLERKTIG